MSSLSVISRTGQQRFMKLPSESGKSRFGAVFLGLEDVFLTSGNFEDKGHFALWSVAESRLLWSVNLVDDPPDSLLYGTTGSGAEDGRVLWAMARGDLITVDSIRPDGSEERLGTIRVRVPADNDWWDYCMPTESARWLGLIEGNDISIVEIGTDGLSDRIPIGRHEGVHPYSVPDPRGRFFLTRTESSEIRRWDVAGNQESKILGFVQSEHFNVSRDGSYLIEQTFPQKKGAAETRIFSIGESGLSPLRRFRFAERIAFDPVGLRLAMRGPPPDHRLWSLAAPAGADPLLLRHGPVNYAHMCRFSPDGQWLAISDQSGLTMWPLGGPYPAVIGMDFGLWMGVDFAPDGRFLATAAGSEVRVWPLEGAVPAEGQVVFEAGPLADLAVSPNGELFAAAGGDSPLVWVVRDGEAPQPLEGTEKLGPGSGGVTFSPDGRFVAAMTEGYNSKAQAIRVWEAATREEVTVLRLDGEQFRGGSRFASDGRLLTGTTKGVVAWDVATGEHDVLVEGTIQAFSASENGRLIVVTEAGETGGMQDPAGSPTVFDLDTGGVTALAAHGLHVWALALDREGAVVVTGDSNGVIRVGPVTGEEPHLLLGHDSQVFALAIDPLGRWIASVGQDKTLRLWPMPDLSKPPLHTAPHDELIAKLKTLTNLRVVRDEDSPTGWKLTHDPFPGWETVSTW